MSAPPADIGRRGFDCLIYGYTGEDQAFRLASILAMLPVPI